MSTKFLKIGFIGAGQMAQAMAKGFIAGGLAKGESIIASAIASDIKSLSAFKDLGAEAITENAPVVARSEIVVIAVKPHIVPIALADISKAENIEPDKLYLSIAMGVTVKRLEKMLPRNSRVIRIMPNTPALVQSCAAVFTRGSLATNDDAAITKQLLRSIGIVEEVSESAMDAVTGLSGSGPAYVFLFIEALADGGVKMGLPRDLAYKLASQTVLGAGRMAKDTKIHPGMLKDNVMSPGGSTATGVHFLEMNAFRAAVIGAVEAATKRCKEVASAS